MTRLAMHEIAESQHRILNPITAEKLELLGEICALQSNQRQLDLACGKGELLCRWASRWGLSGMGVDLSPVFLESARQRSQELGLTGKLSWVQADAAAYPAEPHSFDLVSCLGATWIGKGLVGTLQLMLPALKADGLLLVGECYWIDPAPASAYAACEIGPDEFTSLAGTLDRCASLGLELVEMVQADRDSFDRYVASQWRTVDSWLRSHPEHPEAGQLRDWNARSRRAYLEFERRYLGWTVLVLRPAPS